MDSTAYGPLTQLAWVTDDLDATERSLGAAFGVHAWTRLPDIAFEPATCTYRGAPADFVADISLAYAGDLQLELIRPVRGESLYTEHLAAHGPGMHHVCCEVDDLDAALARAADEGIEAVQQGSMAGGLIRFAYLDLGTSGAGLLELAQVAPDLQAMYADIKGRSRGSA